MQQPSEFNPDNQVYNIFHDNGFMMGRMIAFSKSTYRKSHPDNMIIFNANIVTINDKKVWHGDLDITIDKPKLQIVADILKQDLYILYEMDARFGTDEDPIDVLISKAKVVIKANV